MENSKFPRTYLKFEGKKETNGKKKQFWIQDTTEDMFDEIEFHIVNGFLGDEPMTKYMNTVADPQGIEDLRVLYRNILEDGHTIVCLTKDQENKTKIAGFNMLTLCKANQKVENNCIGETSNRLLKILQYAQSLRNFSKEFDLDTYMNALALYVLPEYRGEGLGERILEARELVCRSSGVPGTITAFTSIISQKLAARAGFKEYISLEYLKLGDVDKDYVIPDIHNHTKYLKYMYKLYN